MDKIAKFLQTLDAKQRQMLRVILADVRCLNIAHYDVRSLQGQKNLFRLRKGKFRIIFYKKNGMGITVRVLFRKDAYKNRFVTSF